MKKRGSTSLIQAIIDIVIVTIVIIALIFVISKFLEPKYDINEEYAKAQLKEIEKKIAEAERSNEAINHQIISVPKDSKHFLVYFEDNHFVTNPSLGSYAMLFYDTEDLAAKLLFKQWKGILFQFLEYRKLIPAIRQPIIATFRRLNREDKQLCACYFTKKDIDLNLDWEAVRGEGINIQAKCVKCIQLQKRVFSDGGIIPLQKEIFLDKETQIITIIDLEGRYAIYPK
jgi:hypothetical protein